MSSFEIQVSCPNCGQVLNLPTANLQREFWCPRCGARHVAGGLVAPSTPLRAIPVTVTESPPAAPQVAPVGLVGYTQPAGFQPFPRPAYEPTHTDVDGTPKTRPWQPYPAATAGGPPAPRPAGAPSGVEQAHRAASAFVMRLSKVAAWVDRIMYGKRLFAIGLGGAITWASYFAKSSSLYAATVSVYASFLFLLWVAWLWWLRDDADRWSWSALWQRLVVPVTDAVVAQFQDGTASIDSVSRQVGGLSAVTGAAILGLAPPLLGLAQELGWNGLVERLRQSYEIGLVLLLVAFVISVARSIRRSRSKSEKPGLVATRALTTFSGTDADFAVDATRGAGRIPAGFPQFVRVLQGWNPRRADKEVQYQTSLARFLRRELPGADVALERPVRLRNGYKNGRLDLVVDDSLVIELKRRLDRSSEIDRAGMQIAKYADAWQRGPILLVICETRADFASSPLVHHVAKLRREGRSVFVVAAGRRID